MGNVGVFILILLLLAAVTGVLGAVLKVTLILVLSLILATILLAWIGVWYAKRRMRAFQRDVEVRIDMARRRRGSYDVGRPGDPPLDDGR
jgi:putative Mn2+ efflux pump MntP